MNADSLLLRLARIPGCVPSVELDPDRHRWHATVRLLGAEITAEGPTPGLALSGAVSMLPPEVQPRRTGRIGGSRLNAVGEAVALGLSDAEVAQQLGLSDLTVAEYRRQYARAKRKNKES